MAVRWSALRTSSRNVVIFLFLVIISVKRLSEPQGQVRPVGIGKTKKSACNCEYLEV
jgi:hypothetical protein